MGVLNGLLTCCRSRVPQEGGSGEGFPTGGATNVTTRHRGCLQVSTRALRKVHMHLVS